MYKQDFLFANNTIILFHVEQNALAYYPYEIINDTEFYHL